jgi:uncharacterized cupin superfamily protein
MSSIKVEKNPSPDRLKALGVDRWPLWSKDTSDFPWSYDGEEICYFLEGEVTVTPEGGEPVTMGSGDLVTFSDGLSCRWQITKPVRKHYRIE